MSLGFLHLSDLRIGTDEDVEGPILAGLVEIVAKERSEGRPLDLIIIAGGLARSGKTAEYAAVTHFCDRLLEAAGLAGQRERLVVVPGDFDVDLSVKDGLTRTLTPDQEEEYFAPGARGHHFAKVAAFEAWRREYFFGRREPREGSTCGPLIRLALGDEEVVLLPINTVLFATRSKDHGELWLDQRELRRSLRGVEQASLRLAVLHHPPTWLHQAQRERARNALSREFDAVLHGHTKELDVTALFGDSGGKTPQLSPGRARSDLAENSVRARSSRTGSAYFGQVVGDHLFLDPITYADHSERWHEDTSRKPDPPHLPRRPPPPSTTTEFVDLRTEATLGGRFRLRAPLGKGGFGWVWRAFDAERGQAVALKVFREAEAFGAQRRLRRFFHGARLIAGIEHPALTRVLEPELRAGGHAFTVMEFIDGRTLAETCRDEPLSEPETLRRLIELGEGLAAAHRAEVIHRDLKPHNVLVARSGALKIIDFDTATHFEGAEYTLTTLHVASPIYSAPEVLNRHASDARADIYSLAATGFFLLTGRDPDNGVSLEEQLRDDVHASERLRAALVKACARFPERRFQSMDAFVGALRGAVSASKGEAGTPSAGAATRLVPAPAKDEAGTPAPEVPAARPESAPPSRQRARLRQLLGLLSLVGGAVVATWMSCQPRGDTATEANEPNLSSATASPAPEDGADSTGPSDGDAAAEGRGDTDGRTSAHPPATTLEGPPTTTTGGEEPDAALAGGGSSSSTGDAEEPVTAPVDPPKKRMCPSGMKHIAGGTFKGEAMPAFCMDTTEVTVAAYKRCVERGLCTKPNAGGRCNYGNEERGRHPVNCVDWEQAQTYCEKAGKRLPKEEEWEWAARGREAGRRYPWGEEAPSCRLAVMKEGGAGCGKDRTWAVGSAGASRDGLLDMSGNVWEWTATKAGAMRILRGGGWSSIYNDDLSVAGRISGNPDLRLNNRGFRCARSAR